MTPLENYLTDASARIDKARELLNNGDWRNGIFELGCASARIFQVVEWLNEHVGEKPPSYRP